jgi:subtilisin family serine protease
VFSKYSISFTLAAGVALAASPAAADRWSWRAYPNGPERSAGGSERGGVGFQLSAEWLLVAPAPGVDVARLAVEATALAKAPRPAEARHLLRDRVMLRVPGTDAAGLETLARALLVRGLAADVWPALSRATGVGFTDGFVAARLRDVVPAAAWEKAGVEFVGWTRLPGVARLRAVDGDAIRAAWALVDLPEVAWAEPDLIRHVKPLGMPDDPELGAQWHLESADDRGDIQANAAWAITTGTPETRIAIFDTGFDLDHPDLVPNLVPGFDAAGNDAIPEAGCSSSPDGAGPAQSCPGDQPYRESHGTAVAGLSAARGGNSLNGTGVCPDCSIYPVRIIADQGFRSLSTAEAFRRAGEDGVSVINNSWGPSLTRFFPLSEAEREALFFVTREARGGLGIAVLFAAGNDFFTPANANPYASYPDVITVAASTRKDDFACYSDYGTVISIAAPSQGCFDGEDGIATTDFQGAEGYSAGDFTTGFGGTSAACPVASGLAGLILSVNPGLTAQQVKVIMEATAAKIRADKNPWQQQFGIDLAAEFAYDERGFSQGFGYGRIDAAAAVALARDMPPAAGAACSDDASCPLCLDGRCATPCAADAECLGSMRCLPVAGAEGSSACQVPRPAATDVGQPCAPDCDVCVVTVDSQFENANICTARCPGGDEECPFGFDCRRLNDNEPAVCVPGNAECGARWDDVRCQSQVQVSGGGEDFCSCECIPGTPGACPEGMVCSSVFCQQTREGILCQASSDREANYLPMCVPDPDFRRACESHGQCGGGMFCIDGTCSPDQGEGGCDICVSCADDSECAAGEACVNIPSRGPHCLKQCVTQDDCPGTTVCNDLPGPGPTYCINENYQSKGICPNSWRCEVEGRCFMESDCPDGVACEDNTCGGALTPDAAVADAQVPADAGPTPDTTVPVTPDAEGPVAQDDAAVQAPDGSSNADGDAEAGSKSSGCTVSTGGLPAGAPLWLAPPFALAAVRLRRRRR